MNICREIIQKPGQIKISAENPVNSIIYNIRKIKDIL